MCQGEKPTHEILSDHLIDKMVVRNESIYGPHSFVTKYPCLWSETNSRSESCHVDESTVVRNGFEPGGVESGRPKRGAFEATVAARLMPSKHLARASKQGYLQRQVNGPRIPSPLVGG